MMNLEFGGKNMEKEITIENPKIRVVEDLKQRNIKNGKVIDMKMYSLLKTF